MRRSACIKVVSFDVGGTLIEPWPSVGHVYAAVAAEAGLAGFNPAELNDRFMIAWKAKTSFDYSPQAWSRIVSDTFGRSSANCEGTSLLFQRLYAAFAKADAWRIYDDVRPTLESLRRRGFRLAVISNWDDRLRPLLCDLKLDGYFDCIQISAEAGVHKPDPEIFLRTARALGVAPDEMLHAGDSPVEDVQGAHAAGLDSVLIRRSPGGSLLGADGRAHEIASLIELLDRVKAPDETARAYEGI